jgi:hypothetical protein
MADLCILRRVDDGPLKLACTNDAHSLAAALADGQAFEIEVFAVYPKCGHLLGQVQKVLDGHLKNGWYARVRDTAISVAVTVAIHALRSPDQIEQERRLGQDDSTASSDTNVAMEQQQQQQLPAAIFEHLELCENTMADKATVVKKGLKAKLGKDMAGVIVSSLKENVLKGGTGDGKQRLLMYQGRPVKLKS